MAKLATHLKAGGNAALKAQYKSDALADLVLYRVIAISDSHVILHRLNRFGNPLKATVTCTIEKEKVVPMHKVLTKKHVVNILTKLDAKVLRRLNKVLFDTGVDFESIGKIGALIGGGFVWCDTKHGADYWGEVRKSADRLDI